MSVKFFSKELPFLKSDSDRRTVKPPETYLSDRLLDKTDAIEHFEKRLEQTPVPENFFLCAVLKFYDDSQNEPSEKANDIFEKTFNQVLDHDRGVWECLDETVFALAFWDYSDEKKAVGLLASLKEKICGAVSGKIFVGYAFYPFKDFGREETFCNAVKALDHAAFFHPGAVQPFNGISLNISADRLYQLGRYPEAIAEYNSGLALLPKDVNLLNSLGVCYAVIGELEKAFDTFNKAFKLKSDELMVVYNIGLMHFLEENFDKALVYLKKAHGIDNEVFEIELLLGQLLFKQNRLNKALVHLHTATGLNPESGLAFRLKGEIFLEQEMPQKAAREFNAAIKINPMDAVSLSGYARSLELQDKNMSIALSFAKNSVALSPDNTLFKERLAVIQDKIENGADTQRNMKSA